MFLHGSPPVRAVSSPPKEEQNTFEGFHFLRAIFSIVIVALKTHVFYIPSLFIASDLAHLPSVTIAYLAVPVFLQTSLFLFYIKSENEGLSYFIQKRLRRLIYLYLFWVGSITIFEFIFWPQYTEDITFSLRGWIEFIISGNTTPYFFFFALIFVTSLAEGLLLLLKRIEKPATKKTISYCGLVLSCMVLIGFATVNFLITQKGLQWPILGFFNSLSQWDYNPLVFIPYVFTTFITAQEFKENHPQSGNRSLRLKLWILSCLAIACLIWEWHLTAAGILINLGHAPLNHYMRPSLVLASWLLLYLALLSRQKVPAVIKFISQCSLGIYGFHVFFTFREPLDVKSMAYIGRIAQISPIFEILLAFTIVFTASIALTVLLRRVKMLKHFVS